MKRNIIVFLFLLGMGFLMYRCTSTPSDVVQSRRRAHGGYYFYSGGRRIWINRSFREGSRGSRYRSGGPRAGK